MKIKISRKEWIKAGKRAGWLLKRAQESLRDIPGRLEGNEDVGKITEPEEQKQTNPSPITIEKYGKFWAVSFMGDLLAVVMYRKGAESIRGLIEKLMVEDLEREQTINRAMERGVERGRMDEIKRNME